MSPKRKIKAIIFDFDGVIVESMGIKEGAFVFLFKDYPEHSQEIAALHRARGGMSRFEKFRIIYEDILKLPYNQKNDEKLSNKFSKYIYEKIIKCPYVAGAKEFLEKYHNKLSLFIASGTPQEEMRDIARAHGIAKYFVEIFGSPEKKGAICKNILREHNFPTDQVIMIGDSIDDYEGADEAGISFIGRVAHENIFANLKISGTVRDLTELEKLI